MLLKQFRKDFALKSVSVRTLTETQIKLAWAERECIGSPNWKPMEGLVLGAACFRAKPMSRRFLPWLCFLWVSTACIIKLHSQSKMAAANYTTGPGTVKPRGRRKTFLLLGSCCPWMNHFAWQMAYLDLSKMIMVWAHPWRRCHLKHPIENGALCPEGGGIDIGQQTTDAFYKANDHEKGYVVLVTRILANKKNRQREDVLLGFSRETESIEDTHTS